MIGSVEKVSWIIGEAWQIHQTQQPIKNPLIHLATHRKYAVRIKPTTSHQKENQHQPFGNGNGLNGGGKFGSNGISG